MNANDLAYFLESKATQYNRPHFIASDPVSIPRLFSIKEDIEIAGFLSASIAWGQRPTIIKNATSLLNMMENSPHDFIVNFSKSDLRTFKKFVHRTFNGDDCITFMLALQKIYRNHSSLEKLFTGFVSESDTDYMTAISGWRKYFFSIPHSARTQKHFADPERGSSAKRINMFLRWMIRKDEHGVDFGIWNLNPALLTCPLDVHSGRVARKLGLLHRKQNDWKAAAELTDALKKFDPLDPVKYDFALFGLGVFEKF